MEKDGGLETLEINHSENPLGFLVFSRALVADTSARDYYKKVELPYAVDRKTMESSYRNGILEIKLKKTRQTS